MKSSSHVFSLVLASIALAVPVQGNVVRRAAPTVYLAGDSTMAKGGGGSGTDGDIPRNKEYVVTNKYS